VTIIATANGQNSSPFYITTRKPYQMLPAGNSPSCSGQYGYTSTLQYLVQDQLLSALPLNTDYNEQWTTTVTPVAGNNWLRPSETPGTTNGNILFDLISGPGDPSASPLPVCTGDSTEVQYWGQEWRLGTQLTGVGPRVQTDTLIRFVNHAEHKPVFSPMP
jgi:hypothetical protein